MTAFAKLLAAARRRLAAAPRESLGEVVAPRRILGIPRAERIVPCGTAWHLGVLLLTDDAVLATGEIVRAHEDVRRGFAAESQRRRAEVAAAARRGGFAEGQTVHIGWRMLELPGGEDAAASDPLRLIDGVPSVRWSAGGGYVPLAAYLDERVGLLLEPPAGA
ncbi:glutaminase [Microbacterium fluvii]|uniref:Glutaminase n=1 Tax=Microbacterium fluvii TaxID=415215 RepID=A0ABW2H982_9MICO|nr:glutaminase [Microbacterium fluvii]MCU4671021.1 glutaminase [Microbacterium fluvii]